MSTEIKIIVTVDGAGLKDFDPIEIKIPATNNGVAIATTALNDYGSFCNAIAYVYLRSICELIFSSNGAEVPAAMQKFYDEVNTRGTPTRQALETAIGTEPSDPAIRDVFKRLNQATRDFTTTLAGTQLGDWNDD